MRVSMVVALTFLLAVLAAFVFLVMEKPSRESRQSPGQSSDVEKAPDQSQLVAALTRASDEIHELRLQVSNLSRLMHGMEGATASRAEALDRGVPGDAIGAQVLERRGSSGPTLRSRVDQVPDPERRKRFDDV